MIKVLKEWFESLAPAGAQGTGAAGQDHALQLATAVLLVEVMRADARFDDAERDAVQHALRETFSLTAEEAHELDARAREAAAQATDLYAFTSHLNQRFEMADKLRIIELMWRVAYADGHLAEHERHVMWRLADLMHIPQGAYHLARQRAQAAAGGPPP
jgi:uncharacterized tellurite resistance protein B-like protein